MGGGQVPLFKFALLTVNMAVLCLVVTLSLSHVHGQHDARSWGIVFYGLAFAWLVMRGAFWTLTMSNEGLSSSATFYLLYWLPNPLQFASFMLLPAFYFQVTTERKTWHTVWMVLRPVYIAIFISMVGYELAIALIAAVAQENERSCVESSSRKDAEKDDHCYRADNPGDAFRIVTIVCFFVLGGIMAAYAWKMARLERGQHRRFLIYQPRALAVMNIFLSLIFLSKGVYMMLSLLQVWYLPNIPLEGSEDIGWENFVAFCLWDYLPTVLLLFVVTNKGKRGVSKRRSGWGVDAALKHSTHGRTTQSSLPDYGLFREIKNEALRIQGKRGSTDGQPQSPALGSLESQSSASYGSAASSWDRGGKWGVQHNSSRLPLTTSGTVGGNAPSSWRWGTGSIFDDPNRYWLGVASSPAESDRGGGGTAAPVATLASGSHGAESSSGSWDTRDAWQQLQLMQKEQQMCKDETPPR